MDCKFQIGDAVVCVEELNMIQMLMAGCHGLVLDEKYHIRAVRSSGLPCQYCGVVHIFVHLKELVMPDLGQGEIGLAHTMFRKLLTVEEFMSKDVGLPVDSGQKVVERV